MTSVFYNEWDANSRVAETLFTAQPDFQGGAYVPPLDYMRQSAITRGSLGAATTPPAGAFATSLDADGGGTGGAERDKQAATAVSPAVLLAVGVVVFYLFYRS